MRSEGTFIYHTNMTSKLTLTWDQSAERVLADRAERLKPHGPPMQLNPLEQAVHFLRGVGSLATMALPEERKGDRFIFERAPCNDLT